MRNSALLAFGLFAAFAIVVGLWFFMRKKEQYSSEEYLEDTYCGNNTQEPDIELVDTEDVRAVGTGAGLYGSGRYTAEW